MDRQWCRGYLESTMDQETRIAALEHLVIALIKENGIRTGQPAGAVFKTAGGSVMGSHGPSGTEQKTAAYDELQRLRFIATGERD